MPAPGYNYVAVRAIDAPGGARAYNAGDDVPESAVAGDDAWLTEGVDAVPRAGVVLSMPPRNASQGAWAGYAVSRGLSADEANGMSRADLIAMYNPEEAAAPAVAPATP